MCEMWPVRHWTEHDERRSACAHLFRRSTLWAEAVWRIPTALLIGAQLPYSHAVTTKWKLGYIGKPEHCNLRNDTQSSFQTRIKARNGSSFRQTSDSREQLRYRKSSICTFFYLLPLILKYRSVITRSTRVEYVTQTSSLYTARYNNNNNNNNYYYYYYYYWKWVFTQWQQSLHRYRQNK